MKFLFAKLDEVGARIAEGAPFTVVTRTGMRIPIGEDPDPIEFDGIGSPPAPRWAVDHALGAIAKLDHAREMIRSDDRLSDFGKREKFGEPREQALRLISTVYNSLADHEAKVLARQAERYAVPALTESGFTASLRDFEIRAAVRDMGRDERARFRHSLAATDNPDMLLAVLRAPLPDEDLHTIATEAWHGMRDRRDPAGRAEIDLALASIEWGKRALGHVVGNVRRLLTVDKDEEFAPASLYELVRAPADVGKLSPAAALFGFDQQQAARFELLISRRKAA